jgi:hypothetical protein
VEVMEQVEVEQVVIELLTVLLMLLYLQNGELMQ